MNIPQWNQNEGRAEFVLGMPLISAGCASLLLIMCHHHGVLWAHAENTLICIGINMIDNIPYACTFKLQSTNIKSLIYLHFLRQHLYLGYDHPLSLPLRLCLLYQLWSLMFLQICPSVCFGLWKPSLNHSHGTEHEPRWQTGLSLDLCWAKYMEGVVHLPFSSQTYAAVAVPSFPEHSSSAEHLQEHWECNNIDWFLLWFMILHFRCQKLTAMYN